MLVHFKVTKWDTEEKKMCAQNGITYADTLGAAVDKLVTEEFEDDEICEITVYECFDTLYDFELKDMIEEDGE